MPRCSCTYMLCTCTMDAYMGHTLPTMGKDHLHITKSRASIDTGVLV